MHLHRLVNRSAIQFISYMLIVLIFAGSLLSVFPARSKAADVQTDAFIAVEDTFAYRDSNNAASQSLIARYNGGGYERISYMKFDLSKLAGSKLETATFKVYLTRTEGVGDVGVYGIYDNNWSDRTVHEKNEDGSYKRPSEINKLLMGTYAFNTVGSNSVNVWLEYDIKDFINSRLQVGITTVTIMLKNLSYTEAPSTAGQGFAYFASSESVHKPTIEINYSTPETPSEPLAKPVPALAEGAQTPLEVKLKWPAVENAVQYTVSRSVYGEDLFLDLPGDIIITNSEIYFNDNTVKSGQRYVYKIKASAIDASFSESDGFEVTVPPLVLQKPNGIEASEVSDNSIHFSWDEVPYAVTYAVYRSEAEASGYMGIGTASSNQYTDTTVSDDTTYFYKIQALRDDTASEMSDVWLVTTLRTIGPGDAAKRTFIPTDDSYINQANENAYMNFGNKQEMIVRHNSGFWKRISYMKFDMGELVGVTQVQKAILRLYLKNVQSGGAVVGLYAIHDNTWKEMEITAQNPPNEEGKELIGSLSALTNTPVNAWYEIDITDYLNDKFGNYEKEMSFMLLGGLDAQRTQGYAYFATKESGNAPGLVIDYIIPEEIPPLETPHPSVYELTGMNVKLVWPVIQGAAGYKVYRKAEDEQQYSIINGEKYNADGNTYYNDTSVEFGTAYEYRVDAIGPDDHALSSEAVAVTTPDLVLNPPSELLVTENKGYELGLSWEAIEFATSYELFRSLNPDSGFELVNEVAGIQYVDTGLELNTSYYYKLKAKRNQYESVLSKAFMVTTEKYATKISGNVKLEASSSHANILVKLMKGNHIVKSTVTDTNGDFVFYGVPNGNYSIEYTKVMYLKKKTMDVLIHSTDLDIGEQGNLKIGDLNGDGAIDIRDLRLIAAAYGNNNSSIDFNPMLDLNRDNNINQADVDRLKQNYFASE